MRTSRVIAAAVAALALLIAGCSGGVSGAAPADAGMPEAPRAPQEPGPETGQRQIARTATVSLVVPDVEPAAAELRRLAESLGGLVTSESLSLPDREQRSGGYSELVLSVPADRLDEALGLIGKLGEVRQRSVEAVDVTDSVMDVDARVKTMRESIARLQELMSRAGSVADIAAVEAELSQRQAELESLLAQQKNLRDRVSMTPISVSLYPPERADEAGRSGFVAGLASGWSALVTAGEVALTALGFLLPWLVLGAVIAVPLVWWRRRRRAARPPSPSGPPASAAQPPSGPPPSGRPTSAAPPPAAPPMPRPVPPSQPPTTPPSGDQPG